MPFMRKTYINVLKYVLSGLFQRICPHFIGADTDSITKIENKNLTVTDLICICSAADALHHLIDKAVFAGDFKLNLGHKGNGIFSAR